MTEREAYGYDPANRGDQPLVVCPVCGVRYPDHTGGATLEHEDVNLHTWTPGPLPDEPLELEDQDDG